MFSKKKSHFLTLATRTSGIRGAQAGNGGLLEKIQRPPQIKSN